MSNKTKAAEISDGNIDLLAIQQQAMCDVKGKYTVLLTLKESFF